MANDCGCDREHNIICDHHLEQAISNRENQMADRRGEW